MRKNRISFRGLDPDLLKMFTEIVKKYHDGKVKGKEGSYVAQDINHLMKLYILSGGTLCHSEALSSKQNVVKNVLKTLAAVQEQKDLDGFTEKEIKKEVVKQCVASDRLDPRTIRNYTKLTMQLLEPNPQDMVLFNVPE